MIEKAILLFGPTAIGKTEVSIEVAKMIGAEIISADSMQVYRYMDIGTAKPSKEQRKSVPHHLIDIVDPDEEWTVSQFIEKASKTSSDIKKKKKRVLMVGGTGLYLNAFINGFSFPIAAKNENVRKELWELEEEELFQALEKVDPDSAKKINKNDKKRIIRALEVFEQTGIPISKLQKRTPKSGLTLICLNDDRDKIYEKINTRVDNMMKNGLIDEVKELLKMGYNKDLTSMQALGYKELVGYLNKEYSLEDAAELIKKRTRNFAKRQLTWFRRFPNVNWVKADKENDLSVKKILLAIVKP